MGEEGLLWLFLIDDSPYSSRCLPNSRKLGWLQVKRLIIQQMGKLSFYELNTQWNHLIKCFPRGIPTAGLGKPQCVRTGLSCQLEDMQWTGNLRRGSVSLPAAQCMLGQAPAPPAMTLNGITRVEKKTQAWMSAPMWSTCTLQLTEPAQQKPHPAVRCVYGRLRWNRAVMRVIIYTALGQQGPDHRKYKVTGDNLSLPRCPRGNP